MHIAICDDNIADRKQLERLLGREEDKRKAASGVFYVDSFGDADGLFSKRMSYDLFFIDVVNDNKNGLEIALDLCKNGVSLPVVLCSSKIDYRNYAQLNENLPENILFIKKPILKADLAEILDKAVTIESNKTPTIELRHSKGTVYVQEDEILWVKSSGIYINVKLTDGTTIEVMDSLYNFHRYIAYYTHFARISRSTLINIVHVEKRNLFRIVMKDYSIFNIDFIGLIKYKHALSLLGQEKEI